ncbi:hypothetical protein [Streptomyces flavofungini]|uniref:hypothetical protein n=1 Tax=Streptomyces flavofungini TaxID=68200 RepID=UPI0034DEBCE4
MRLRNGGRVRAAAAAAAAQLPAAALLAYALTSSRDDYGAGGSPAFGMACCVLFAPLVFPVIGMAHAALLDLPAAALGHLAATRLGRGPEWAWSLAWLLPAGGAWAALCAALGAPFAASALWIVGSGVLPVLNVAYCARRAERLGRPLRKVWIISGLASVPLALAVFGIAVLATATGLIEDYEPPKLGPGQLAGAWRDADGGEERFRLDADGRAWIAGCRTTGGWAVGFDEVLARPSVVIAPEGKADAGAYTDEDGDGDGEGGGCRTPQAWLTGGTADDPELFVTEGDPDAPDVIVLRRHRDG